MMPQKKIKKKRKIILVRCGLSRSIGDEEELLIFDKDSREEKKEALNNIKNKDTNIKYSNLDILTTASKENLRDKTKHINRNSKQKDDSRDEGFERGFDRLR